MRSGSSHRSQRGFTYLAAMVLVAMLGAGLAAYGETWTHAQQRDKEAELVWIGNQFREAIGLYYQRTPGSVKRFPQTLEDLLEDKRFLSRQRYLRRLYIDPFTGTNEWGLIQAPGGGIAGVFSLTEGRSIGRAVIGRGLATLPDGVEYKEWKFAYEPPLPPSRQPAPSDPPRR